MRPFASTTATTSNMGRFKLEGYGYDAKHELMKLEVTTDKHIRDLDPTITALGSDSGNRTQFAILDGEDSLIDTFHHYMGAIFFVEGIIEEEAYKLETYYWSGVVELSEEEVDSLGDSLHDLREAVEFED
jgi:hypothetical protein